MKAKLGMSPIAWWDVAVPEVSERKQVNAAREGYVKALQAQRLG